MSSTKTQKLWGGGGGGLLKDRADSAEGADGQTKADANRLREETVRRREQLNIELPTPARRSRGRLLQQVPCGGGGSGQRTELTTTTTAESRRKRKVAYYSE